MLYLEDYLETVDALPADMQHSFTKMREIDLNAQSVMEKTEKNAKSYFLEKRRAEELQKSEGASKNAGGGKDEEFEKLKRWV